jgi:catechol 2,3-dioxygenase-like lactoylglutathione lyase family enzyme
VEILKEVSMADVEGIGGVFIYSDDATQLAVWYERVLGIEMEAHPDGIGYYRVFPTRDIETSSVRENPVFAINQAQEKLAERGRGFVLNLRVDNLAEFLEQIRSKGIEIEDRILEWERGRHAWIRDRDGNRLELYEEILLEEAELVQQV